MPHPDAEHGLQIQLATALRERDTLRAENGRLRKSLTDARYWMKNHLDWISKVTCDKCDPGGEGVEVYSELVANADAALAGGVDRG